MVQYSGSSAPATFTTGGGLVTTAATPAAADSANAATVKLSTDNNGNLTQIDISAPIGVGGPFSKTFIAGSQAFLAPITLAQLVSIAQAQTAAASGQATYIYQGTGSGLNVSSYGAWIQANGSNNFTVGPVAFGVETTPAQIATLTGVANYVGSTFGIGATGTTPFAFTGTAQVTANFPAGAVSTTFSGFATQNLSGIGTSITLPATIGGNGTIGLGVNANQYAFALAGSSGGFTGNVTGTFYGTTAQETAGVWQATDSAVTPTTLTGTFGAHK